MFAIGAGLAQGAAGRSERVCAYYDYKECEEDSTKCTPTVQVCREEDGFEGKHLLVALQGRNTVC